MSVRLFTTGLCSLCGFWWLGLSGMGGMKDGCLRLSHVGIGGGGRIRGTGLWSCPLPWVVVLVPDWGGLLSVEGATMSVTSRRHESEADP